MFLELKSAYPPVPQLRCWRCWLLNVNGPREATTGIVLGLPLALGFMSSQERAKPYGRLAVDDMLTVDAGCCSC